jgi:hypothetical protein
MPRYVRMDGAAFLFHETSAMTQLAGRAQSVKVRQIEWKGVDTSKRVAFALLERQRYIAGFRNRSEESHRVFRCDKAAAETEGWQSANSSRREQTYG